MCVCERASSVCGFSGDAWSTLPNVEVTHRCVDLWCAHSPAALGLLPRFISGSPFPTSRRSSCVSSIKLSALQFFFHNLDFELYPFPRRGAVLDPYPRPAHPQISAKEAELAAAVTKIADLEQLHAAAAAEAAGQALADKEGEAEELRNAVSRAAGENRVKSSHRASLCVGWDELHHVCCGVESYGGKVRFFVASTTCGVGSKQYLVYSGRILDDV